MSASQRNLGLVLALFLGCLFLYWPTTNYEFVDVDDAQFARENPWVREGLSGETVRWAFTQEHASNWIPFTFLSLALDSTLFGTEPGPYHRGNVLLHALATVLLFAALRALSGRTWLAFWIAALWAIHPLRVESVAWISERKDVLSGAFGFASLWAYAAYARTRSRVAYVGCALLLLFGLLSKAMLVTWPCVFVLLDHWPLRRALGWRRQLVEKSPFAALVILSSAATFLAQRSGGAVSNLNQLAVGDRLSNALVSYIRYLGDLVWPIDLAYLYPHPSLVGARAGWSVLVIAICALVLVLVTGLLWRSARRAQPALWIGWLFYLGTLVPVLGVLQVGVQSKADRYTYLPHVGLLLALVFGCAALAERRAGLRRPLIAIGVVVLCLCGWQTRRQMQFWADSESLFRHAIEVTTDNAYAQNGLGAVLGQRGEYAEARPHLEEALRIDPNFADAHLNLGIVLTGVGELRSARTHYERAVALEPDSGLAHLNIGILQGMEGELLPAERSLLRARQLGPERWQTELNLALIQMALGKRVEAMDSLRRARRLNPQHPTILQKWSEWGLR